MRYKAVIFDLDGLVLDSESSYVLAWRLAAGELGYRLDEAFLRSLSGVHGQMVEALLLSYCGGDFDINRFKQLSGIYWNKHVQQHGIAVKKGFFSLLKVIAQFELPFCLATNSRRSEAMQCLALAGLDKTFPAIITRDDVTQAKPAPDIFLYAATVLGISITDCLVLEDSPVGITAAVAAASPCLYIPSAYPIDAWAASKAVAVMDDLEQAGAFISTSLGQLF